MATMVFAQGDRGSFEVADERVVAPRGEQLGLLADQACAAHDEAMVVAIGGFGFASAFRLEIPASALNILGTLLGFVLLFQESPIIRTTRIKSEGKFRCPALGWPPCSIRSK